MMIPIYYLIYPLIVALGFKLYKVWSKRQTMIQALSKLPVLPAHFINGHLPYLWEREAKGLTPGEALIAFVKLCTGQDPYSKIGAMPIWIGPIPVLLVYRPETAEVILNSQDLIPKSQQYDFLDPWLGTGLLTSKGDKWKNHRRMLTPAFHFKILEDFIPIMSDMTQVLIEIMEEKVAVNNGMVDNLADLMLNAALDTICGESIRNYLLI